MIRHRLLISTLLLLSWIITWLILAPGLTGPFLFDDFPNLEMIGAFGPINNWELFKIFVLGGVAGPLGRPIALATFLLNTNDWPADPETFKYTNILIHILIGVVLFPTIRKILYSIGFTFCKADWVALIATTLWLFNPFLVSTTLYVVQRMTQLSALFSVIGVWAYLTGRFWLPKKPLYAYFTLSLSVIIGTLLAAYSKENGILLPVLILSIEFALYYHWTVTPPDWRWQVLFLGVPTAIVVIYLGTYLPDASKLIDTRNFSVAQRILTEPRIIWEYLFYLLVPHIQTRGLYHDGIAISTTLTSPWTTLPAILGLLALAVGGFLARNKFPLLSLAILFFLGGHLLESTASTLELYFEHRNYLPSIFLFLPMAAGIIKLWNPKKPWLPLFIACSLCSSYGLSTLQYSKLWGNEGQLMLVWAKMNPDSARAQNSAVQTLDKLGQSERAIEYLEESLKTLPNSSLLISNYLSYKADLGQLTSEEFSKYANRLLQLPFDPQLMRALNHLVLTFNSRAPLPEHSAIMMSMLESMRDNLQGRIPIVHRYTYYLQGLLLSGQGDGDGAYHYFTRELDYTKNLESSLNMMSILADRGYFQHALGILEQSQRILEAQPDKALKRPRNMYEKEIEKLRTTLHNDILTRGNEIRKKTDIPVAHQPDIQVDILPESQ